MESKPAKQRITLALDTLGMKGRFTVRDVAEQALRNGIKFDGLSLADQREVMLGFLMKEAKMQMKAPLRQDLKEAQIKRLPKRYWPVLEKLTKTICVAPGGSHSYHVFTMYATREDWESYLEMAEVMATRAQTARNSGRNIRDLLKKENKETLAELITGQKPKMIAVRAA